MRAVIWTDVFQFVAMYGGMAAIVIKVGDNNLFEALSFVNHVSINIIIIYIYIYIYMSRTASMDR